MKTLDLKENEYVSRYGIICKRPKRAANGLTEAQQWRSIYQFSGIYLYEISGREVPKKQLIKRGLI